MIMSSTKGHDERAEGCPGYRCWVSDLLKFLYFHSTLMHFFFKLKIYFSLYGSINLNIFFQQETILDVQCNGYNVVSCLVC